MKIFKDIINLITYKEPNEYNFILPKAEKRYTEEKPSSSETNSDELQVPAKNPEQKVFPSIDVNKEYIKKLYDIPTNSDIKLREFFINIRGKQYSAFLLYIDGMIDSHSINKFVIEPLMLKNPSNTQASNSEIVSTAVTNNLTVRRVKKFHLNTYVLECLVPQNDVTTETKFKKISELVNIGNSALFIDTIDSVFLIDAKGFEKRSVSPPENETIIRGSQEGFIESIRTNTSLLRRIVNSENMIIENLNVRKSQ